MENIMLDELKAHIEKRFQEKMNEINKAKQEIEQWRNDKIAAIEVLLGERSTDEWLSDVPELGSSQKRRVQPSGSPNIPRGRKKSPTAKKFNQTQMVRDAIDNISGEISIDSVRSWINENRSDCSDRVKPQSIRSALARLEANQELKTVRLEGQMKVYGKTNNKNR